MSRSSIQTPALVQRANDILEVRAFRGTAPTPTCLPRAGARDADMLIAVTLADEVNMVACQIASNIFDIPTKIARVRAQTYLDKKWVNLFSREWNCHRLHHLARDRGRQRRAAPAGACPVPSKRQVSPRAIVLAIGVNCGPELPDRGTPRYASSQNCFPICPQPSSALCVNGELLAVYSDAQLAVGDDVYVICPNGAGGPNPLKIFGHEETQARRMIIAGGGNIGLFVARAIEEPRTATYASR